MRPVVISQLKNWVRHYQLDAFGVSPHPFSAHEESRRDSVFMQEIDHVHINAGSVCVELAHVECQRDGFNVWREFYAPDDAFVVGERCKRVKG